MSHSFDRAFKALAMVVPLLVDEYGRAKGRLSRWLKVSASSLGVDDFDSQRERGQDVRNTSTIPDISEADRRALESMPEDLRERISFMETVAPGLLILLTPQFVDFALRRSFPFDSLTAEDAFLDLTSMGVEQRAVYKSHFNGHPDCDTVLLPLFKVLSGEDCGPWSRLLPGKLI